MTWSNFDYGGYCVAVAESESIYGPWSVKKDRLYSKTHGYKYDGGHGMTFYDENGDLWLVIHSPNSEENGRKEKPVFIPIEEKDGQLKVI